MAARGCDPWHWANTSHAARGWPRGRAGVRRGSVSLLTSRSPLTACRYQIVVMFMLTVSVAITATIAALWYCRTFFTPALQLRGRDDP
ncbi:MAG: ABC transporter permease [Gemmatimonadales bacterium]|nr:ABC transporter permease [Gemmatimonadales bacterium]